MNLARLGNKYLATLSHKLKTNIERTQTILNISLQIASHFVFSEPFLPFTARKLDIC